MNESQKAALASALGIPSDERAVLDAGSNHPGRCTCALCLRWWVLMGPEDGEPHEGNYGPFTRQQVIDEAVRWGKPTTDL